MDGGRRSGNHVKLHAIRIQVRNSREMLVWPAAAAMSDAVMLLLQLTGERRERYAMEQPTRRENAAQKKQI